MTTTQHPDAALIQAAAQAAEDRVQEGDLDNAHSAVERIISPFVDPGSVRAASRQRTNPIVDNTPELVVLTPKSVLRSVWIDGFVLGVMFQQSGGHTEP